MKIDRMSMTTLVACMMATTTVSLAQSGNMNDPPRTTDQDRKTIVAPMDSGRSRLNSTPDADKAAREKAATPGEMHRNLEKCVGTWDLQVKSMLPGQPVSESTGTCTSESMLGGRFIHSMVKGEQNGQPFEGMALIGYNNNTGKVEQTWVDNMCTGTVLSTGTFDADKKVLTLNGEKKDPASGKMIKCREVTTSTGDDRKVTDYYITGDNGAEIKIMEIIATRSSSGNDGRTNWDRMNENNKRNTDANRNRDAEDRNRNK